MPVVKYLKVHQDQTMLSKYSDKTASDASWDSANSFRVDTPYLAKKTSNQMLGKSGHSIRTWKYLR